MWTEIPQRRTVYTLSFRRFPWRVEGKSEIGLACGLYMGGDASHDAHRHLKKETPDGVSILNLLILFRHYNEPKGYSARHGLYLGGIFSPDVGK